MTLDELFIKYGTDKSSLHHGYAPIYEKILEPFKGRLIDIFALGIGGYYHPDKGGGDLRAFREWLPMARITAIDKYNKEFLQEYGIITHICKQDDEKWLPFFCIEADIIIDDCSHINPLTIKSFELLFPRLNKRGIYVIEDLESSYWDEIATDGTDFKGGNHPNTVMNYFKSKADCLNYKHALGKIEGIEKDESWSKSISSIHFYRGIIVIEKH